jgi:ABC-type uncharacterized transport system ATPase subunit
LDTWLERLSLAKRAADRLDTLSHGHQQRVQLIAALVNEPGRQGVVQPALRDHPDPEGDTVNSGRLMSHPLLTGSA